MSKHCNSGCCLLKFRNYTKTDFCPKNGIKAGIFIIDETQQKILLVQSRGNLWGSPKGSKEVNETIKECAIREVREETGLLIGTNLIDDNNKFIYNNAHYYYLNLPETLVSLDRSTDADLVVKQSPDICPNDNDASGIGWINVKCLANMIDNKEIYVNYHCKLLLEYFSKIQF